jgi:hypothetical protein
MILSIQRIMSQQKYFFFSPIKKSHFAICLIEIQMDFISNIDHKKTDRMHLFMCFYMNKSIENGRKKNRRAFSFPQQYNIISIDFLFIIFQSKNIQTIFWILLLSLHRSIPKQNKRKRNLSLR